MSILTRWVRNDDANTLLEHCPSHILDIGEHTPEMEPWHYAYRPCTSLSRGKLGDYTIAVKVWRGAHMNAAFKEKFTKRLSVELDNWKRALHPNVAPFLGVMSGFGHLPSLVQTFHENGNVNEYVAKNPDADLLYLVHGIARGLAYMHSLDPPVVHGGVRGVNVLITDSGEPQLSDVSISSLPTPPDLTSVGGEFLGTRWMAPEVIDPPPEFSWGDGSYYETLESDVYSFGMTVLEIFSGRQPFAHRRLHTGVIFDVVQGIRPPRPACPQLTDPVWQVIESCWNQDPRERPPMGAVCTWLQLIFLTQKAPVVPGCERGLS